MSRARLQFRDATCDTLSIHNTEEGRTGVLLITTPFNRVLAAELDSDFMFEQNGEVRETYSGGKLDIQLRDVDLALPAGDSFQNLRPDIIHGFIVRKLDDSMLELQFRAKFKSNVDDLYVFHSQVAKNSFECAIVSLQAEFDFTGKQAELGGAQVPLSGVNGDFGCTLCDSGVSLNSEGLHMLSNGTVEPCTAERKAESGDEPKEPLPDPRELNGGVTPGRKPRNRRAPVDPETEREAQLDGVSVGVVQ